MVAAAPAHAASTPGTTIGLTTTETWYPSVRAVLYDVRVTNPTQDVVVITVASAVSTGVQSASTSTGWFRSSGSFLRSMAPGETSPRRSLTINVFALDSAGEELPPGTAITTTLTASGPGLTSTMVARTFAP